MVLFLTAAVAAVTNPEPAPSDAPLDLAKVQPGWTGLIFFVLMAVAVALLMWSMRRHLGRVNVDRTPRDTTGAAGPSVQENVPKA